jgi:transposase
MPHKALIIGIDVAQDELVMVACNADATLHVTRTVANHKRGFATLVRWARTVARQGQLDTIHAALEATGVYGYQLALYLSRTKGITVSVLNPAQVAAFGQAQLRRTRTDPVAAEVIAAFVISQRPPAWVPARDAVVQLRALVGRVWQLQKTYRQEANRLHALKVAGVAPPTVLASVKQTMRLLDEQIKSLRQEVRTLVAQDARLEQQVALLRTIPSVGLWSAAQLLAHGESVLARRDRKAVVAYAGLAPAQHQSGASVRGRSHLAKAGNATLRRVLYMPAMGGATRSRGINPALRPLYQRLRAKGKPAKLALTACMRKLLEIVHSMLKYQTPFNPEIYSVAP